MTGTRAAAGAGAAGPAAAPAASEGGQGRAPRPGRPRVLVVAKGWPPAGGGVERYAEQVATAYAGAGFDVHVVAPVEGGGGGPWSVTPIRSRRQAAVAVELVARLGLAGVRLGLEGSAPGPAGAGRAQVGGEGPGGRRSWLEGVVAVHATTWRVAVPFMALGWHRRVPVVVTAHGREILSPTGPARFVRDQVCRRAALLVAVSPFTATVARAATGLRFEAVLNGTSAPTPAAAPTAPAPCNRLRLLTVCRLEPRKNVDGILAAMAELRSRHRLELTVVGDGPERDQLEAQARELGLEPVVRFTGRVSDADLWDHYRRADVFVHPQVALDGGVDVEGFGLTIADAMAFGLPVVVGRDGGPGTVVPASGGGLVVDGTDRGDLAAAIDRLAGDADLRHRLGENGARFAASRLTWPAHVAAIARHLGLRAGAAPC